MHVVLIGNTSFKIANFRAGLVRALLADGHRVTVLAPPDATTPELERLGCAVVPFAMTRHGKNPRAELLVLARMIRDLRRLAPDAVLSYTIKPNIYAGLACRRLGIPFAPNVTGLGAAFDVDGPLNRLIRAAYRRAFRDAGQVFFQNDRDCDLFLSAGIVGARRAVRLPGSGVDLVRFAPPRRPTIDTEIRFLLVARLLRDKGVADFAAAARLVRRENPAIRCQLLGPCDTESRTAISRTELDEWVRAGDLDYLGAAADVRPHLAQAACVVLPSYYREGTPRALLEAAAMACPIITTDMPGCRDAVRPGRSGLLVPPRDARALADAMLKIAALPHAARMAMGAEGRAHMARDFDERIVIDAYRAYLATARPRSVPRRA